MKTTSRNLIRVLALALSLMACCAVPAVAAEVAKKILVVTVTTGFRHSSIPMAEKTLERLARESGRFTVDFVRQPEGMPRAPGRPRPGPKGEGDPVHQAAMRKFTETSKAYQEEWMPKIEAELRKLSPENLRNYDAVLFASTSGDLPIPDRQGLLDWIASGKAFIGVHAATDTLHGFPPFIAMIGGEFRTHGPQVAAECLNQDPAHAACRPLPAKWALFDEIYQFKNFDHAKTRTLLRLDSLMLTAKDIEAGKATPGDYPLAWAKAHGRGRVFYTALGHREDMWDPAYTEEKGGRRNSPENARLFQQHLLGGMLWALGLAPGEAGP